MKIVLRKKKSSYQETLLQIRGLLEFAKPLKTIQTIFEAILFQLFIEGQ